MTLTASPTELTTAATDAVLAAVCIGLLIDLHRRTEPSWLRPIWASVFLLLASGSVLGAIAHAFDWPAAVRRYLWAPLYLSLGLTVAMFVVGAVAQWRGPSIVRAISRWAIAAAFGFFVVTQVFDNFLLFVLYEAVAMAAALAIYVRLALVERVPGAALVSAGIVLTLIAAAVQQTSWSLRLVWFFDHNGLFHLVQLPAVFVIAAGVRAGMRATAVRAKMPAQELPWIN